MTPKRTSIGINKSSKVALFMFTRADRFRLGVPVSCKKPPRGLALYPPFLLTMKQIYYQIVHKIFFSNGHNLVEF